MTASDYLLSVGCPQKSVGEFDRLELIIGYAVAHPRKVFVLSPSRQRANWLSIEVFKVLHANKLTKQMTPGVMKLNNGSTIHILIEEDSNRARGHRPDVVLIERS
jgi:hypothetical protein